MMAMILAPRFVCRKRCDQSSGPNFNTPACQTGASKPTLAPLSMQSHAGQPASQPGQLGWWAGWLAGFGRRKQPSFKLNELRQQFGSDCWCSQQSKSELNSTWLARYWT